MLYFSYGANLNRIHMARLCPGAELLYPAVLEGYTLTVRRWFNVGRMEGSVVFGGVWEIGEGHLPKLDWYEDCPELYERREVRVNILDHGRVGAWGHGRKNGVGVSVYRGIGEKEPAYLDDVNGIECLVYVMKQPFALPLSPPDMEYLQMVREGYEEWGLSSEQLDSALLTAIRSRPSADS